MLKKGCQFKKYNSDPQTFQRSWDINRDEQERKKRMDGNIGQSQHRLRGLPIKDTK